MGDDIDFNKIAAEFAASRIDHFLDSGKKLTKNALVKFRARMKMGYTKYLKNIGERYGYTRSFFIRDEAVYLYSFFIPISLRCGDQTIESASWQKVREFSKYSVISASGGSGKSILLKHFLLNALYEQDKIPVFIELRGMNDSQTSILDYVLESLNEFELDLDHKFFEAALTKGHFLFLLDGYDDVPSKRRKGLIREVESLTKSYPKNEIVLASRPDQTISELAQFSTFHALPFSLRQCLDLIDKLPAEDEIKTRFMADLEDGLYEKHKSFLSNPLLLSIMLLTYGYSADIPNKLTIFYNQAYEALFQRHDALKGAFKREKESDLDIQDFGRVFSAFCLLTYDDRALKFSHTDALVYLEQAKKILGIPFDSNDYITDLLQSVCLLSEDGLFYGFSHRSFQEYFTARFICSSSAENKKRFLKRFEPYIGADSVFKMVYELDPDFFETHLILPQINRILHEIRFKKNVGITVFLRFTKKLWTKFEFRGGRFLVSPTQSKMSVMVRFIMQNCVDKKDMANQLLKMSKKGLIKDCIERSKVEDELIVFQVSEMKINDEFSKALYSSRGWCSKYALELVVDLKTRIEERAGLRQSSIDDLIFGKNAEESSF